MSVEHLGGIADLDVGAQILDARLVEHVGTDLVAPGHVALGVFEYLGVRMSKVSKGNMWRLMVMFCIFTATISMLIDNVTTVLLIVPITISIFKTLKISPIPFILAQVLASNVGGTATLVGDPPNILIGSAANIDFSSFIINMGPTVAVSLFASLFILKFQFRKYLEQKPHNIEDLLSQD